MKKFIFSLILSITAYTIHAQDSKPAKKESAHKISDIKDDKIDKYAGIWVSKQGNEVFTLKLKKVNRNMGSENDPLYVEALLGSYSYVVDGEEIVKISDSENAVAGGSLGKEGPITIYMTDKTSGKRGEGTLMLVSKNTLNWQIGNIKEDFFGNNKKAFTIPTSLTLKRVE